MYNNDVFNHKQRSVNLEKVKELEQIISDKLDIINLLEEYGVDTGDGQKMSSPFGDDLAPSFFINRERQLWNDFSQSWGGGFVYLYQKLNLVLKGRKLNYYDTLEEILKRYPIVRQHFTGSLYTVENISSATNMTTEDLIKRLNSKSCKLQFIDINKSKKYQARKLATDKSKTIDDILNFCIQLQEDSEIWHDTEKKIKECNGSNMSNQNNSINPTNLDTINSLSELTDLLGADVATDIILNSNHENNRPKRKKLTLQELTKGGD